jgi:hypothetical protein
MIVVNWLIAHQLVLGGFIIAILDFIFALKPDWESNGILHSIYIFIKNLGKPANGNS